MSSDNRTRQQPVPDRWSVDTVAQYVGVTALASAALLVAGLGFTSAYLAAWRIPVSAIQLDPLTTALRSDAAIYDAVLIGVVALRLKELSG